MWNTVQLQDRYARRSKEGKNTLINEYQEVLVGVIKNDKNRLESTEIQEYYILKILSYRPKYTLQHGLF
jgi:hypothetical protein